MQNISEHLNNCFLPKERVVTKQGQNSVMTLTALFYTQIYCSYDQIYKEPHTVSRLAMFHADRGIRNERRYPFLLTFPSKELINLCATSYSTRVF